jgi:hypothetical protein
MWVILCRTVAKVNWNFAIQYLPDSLCTVSTFCHLGLNGEHSRRCININLMCRNELSFLILAIVYLTSNFLQLPLWR